MDRTLIYKWVWPNWWGLYHKSLPNSCIFLHQKSKQSNDENDIKNLKHNYCRFTYSITKWVGVTISTLNLNERAVCKLPKK